MRVKLFLAFFAVMAAALVSVFLFERLIIADFEDYAKSSREDRLYWVLAAIEGSYQSPAGWDRHSLEHAVQWGAIVGVEVSVLDTEGNPITDTAAALSAMTPTMRRRVESIARMDAPGSDAGYEEFPLYAGGEEIGTLRARHMERLDEFRKKETIFKQRGREFLLLTFAISCGLAMALSLGFSLFLSRPLRRLRLAAEAVGAGDLGVRVEGRGRDDIGLLIHAFNHMVESLGREEALRRHLTSNIAHELRTPIAVLRANLEAIADGVVEVNAETVATLSHQAERLTLLVEGIEDFRKAEESFFKPVTPEEVVLRQMLESILQSMRPLASAKGLALRLDEAPDDRCTLDTEKVESVLRILLVNALRHTHEGAVAVRARIEDGRLIAEVADTGEGIKADDMPYIFQRFYKGKGSDGKGLGLAIARELVEIMGGAISAKSDAGRGAVFTVSIPLARIS